VGEDQGETNKGSGTTIIIKYIIGGRFSSGQVEVEREIGTSATTSAATTTTTTTTIITTTNKHCNNQPINV